LHREGAHFVGHALPIHLFSSSVQQFECDLLACALFESLQERHGVFPRRQAQITLFPRHAGYVGLKQRARERETYGVETLGVVYVAERHGIVVVVVVVVVVCVQSGEPSA
jgi:hypothetical protein